MSKFALITGASRGIGKAISHYFAQQGYSLILVSRNKDNLNQTKLELESLYTTNNIETITVDFNKPTEVESAIKSIIARHDTIDVLVNSAGILMAGHTNLTLDQLSELINVNLVSTIMTCNLVVEKMKLQGYGEVYNLGSTSGLEPVAKIAAYSATKAAIVSYSQSLYQELLPDNIQVCCLCPSVVDTDMTNDGRIANDLKIEPQDLIKAIDFVRSLSSGASMPTLPIRCKVIDLEK
ncbi:SDR family oxidoreductase [Shewanella psychropiezotolerans]|uniref:SDR family oxidoreductase n=1 Tax=Shewanella psychropiezotolerans TaxID=2593655 RepID=A0ABX5WX60_9GAMM|nr:SDR family oxidoreductase [Shewanella psychropiezotolerans]QDO83680.1 SDR family oxidoreductase [Shewanella psychropiezotolerans]